MNKKMLVILAIASLTVLSGCFGNENKNVNTSTETVVEEPSGEETVAVGISYATFEQIGTKLKTAGLTYTTKDETEDALRLPSKDAILKSTKFRVAGGKGSVRVTVTELKETALDKQKDVVSEIETQWKTVLGNTSTKYELVETEYPNLVVGVTNEAEDASIAASAKAAVMKK